MSASRFDDIRAALERLPGWTWSGGFAKSFRFSSPSAARFFARAVRNEGVRLDIRGAIVGVRIAAPNFETAGRIEATYVGHPE